MTHSATRLGGDLSLANIRPEAVTGCVAVRCVVSETSSVLKDIHRSRTSGKRSVACQAGAPVD
ncbi:hypothetical protein QE408_000652 [Agrobacterium larrymoorei]|uniref:Uncharacterized protein n=1 Tax=Agrobacterium larrymoorei TaxID=160699 RepID=A0ABU0UF12_9HYPH|nr:hypothetical protein [Agrobacterium larrymoorei]